MPLVPRSSTKIEPYWVSDCGRATLYLADCLKVLPILQGSIDAIVTDPPYGVNFQYLSYSDKQEGYQEWCASWFAECQSVCKGPIAISCGISNLCDWPKPDWVMCWHKPACMGRCTIGFNNWEPILVYGKSRGKQTSDVVRAPITPDDSLYGHPCPKPLGWGLGIVEKLTIVGDTVLDVFTGSGTTGVACIELDRKFIGIEIEEKYCDIAIGRIRRKLIEKGYAKDTPPPARTKLGRK